MYLRLVNRSLVFLLLAFACFTQWRLAWSGDKQFLLESARLWLSGKKLYSGIFQPNFPFIIWLYALPDMASAYAGITCGHALIVLTFVFILLSTTLCYRIMKHHPAFAGDRKLQCWHGIVLLFLLVFFVHPAFFGDREHWIIIFMLPYFLRCMPSLARVRFPLLLSITIGVLAAFGACVKPHALILLAGVGLLQLLRERKLQLLFSRENFTIVATLAVYLQLMACFTNEYFSIVLPMLLATYSGYSKGLLAILYYVTSAFVLSVTLADFRLRYDSPFRQDILYLLGLCVFCLGYILANNGWIYTFYPLNSMILLLTVWVLWEFRWLRQNHVAQGKSYKQFTFGATACSINLLCNLLAAFLLLIGMLTTSYDQTTTPRSRMYKEMTQLLIDQHTQGFGMMSDTFAYWPETMESTGIPLQTRFNHLWMLKRFLSSGEDFARKYAWITDYTANAYAEDLNQNKPDILFVDANSNYAGTGKPFDLIAYYSASAAFADAMTHYRLLKIIDHCDDPDTRNLRDKNVWCRQIIYHRKPD